MNEVNNKKGGFLPLQTMMKVAMFAALGFVLGYFRFPVPIFPAFLEFDIADVPIVVGALLMGTIPGILIVILTYVLGIIIRGTTTMGIGPFMNIMLGMTYVIVINYVYGHFKSDKGLVLGAILASLAGTLMGALLNYTLVINAYAHLFGGMDRIINMARAVHPSIDSVGRIVMFSIVPFNLIKFTYVSILAVVMYKAMERHVKWLKI